VRTIVRGKNLDIWPADREYAESKMRRLQRILDDRTDAILEFSVEGHRSIEDGHIVEATLSVNGRPLRGVARGATHRAALDTLIDKLERRAIALKEKPRDWKRKRGASAPPPEGLGELEEPEEAGPPQIVKVKRFGIEPMFEEDAVAQMEELGHQYFVFVNAENERLAVLYRRRGGDYGLIEPVIAGEYSANGRGQTARSRARAPARPPARARRGIDTGA
jgi:putative sigma-54 modulation protein